MWLCEDKLKRKTAHFRLPSASQTRACLSSLIGSLRTRVFETRTATGREHFECQDSGVSQIFILIFSNEEKILSSVNVVVKAR